MPKRKRERAPRYARSLSIRLRFGGRGVDGHLINISSTGALLRLPTPLLAGSRVKILFPKTAPGLSLRARVVRMVGAAASIHNQIAVRFHPETATDRQIIRSVINAQRMGGLPALFKTDNQLLHEMAIIFAIILKIGLYLILPAFLVIGILAA